ncbi:MAG: regulatory protein RecX [Saprospiraceae bacterium]|nr:regulatory protein RecX [Saprospiraceae bacterium]
MEFKKKAFAKPITKEIALQKLQSFCGYQERSTSEVTTKLRDLGIFSESLDWVLAKLIDDNFLNEERFAIAYARGKFRIKSWGKIRIKLELQNRRVPETFVKKALKEMDTEGGYLETLERLLVYKLKETEGDRDKAAGYALRRGFESEYVFETLNRIVNSNFVV